MGVSMLQKTVYVCAGVLSFAVVSALADTGVPVDLPARARGAERVVVASVQRVRPEYRRNQFGDELIISQADLRVSETLKGRSAAGETVVVEVEGGTIGEVTLHVSDLPALAAGENAVFFLERVPGDEDKFVPHLRGLGILKLDAAGRVIGTGSTLADVRRAVTGR
jgi:hypothetical protein